jgi:hypothetical protein
MHPASDDLLNNELKNERAGKYCIAAETTAENARRARIQKPAAARRNGMGATSRLKRATQD